MNVENTCVKIEGPTSPAIAVRLEFAPGAVLFVGNPTSAFGDDPGSLVAVGTQPLPIVFTATSGAGREPWVTDGTPAGTFQLLDIQPGPGSSQAASYARAQTI